MIGATLFHHYQKITGVTKAQNNFINKLIDEVNKRSERTVLAGYDDETNKFELSIHKEGYVYTPIVYGTYHDIVKQLVRINKALKAGKPFKMKVKNPSKKYASKINYATDLKWKKGIDKRRYYWVVFDDMTGGNGIASSAVLKTPQAVKAFVEWNIDNMRGVRVIPPHNDQTIYGGTEYKYEDFLKKYFGNVKNPLGLQIGKSYTENEISSAGFYIIPKDFPFYHLKEREGFQMLLAKKIKSGPSRFLVKAHIVNNPADPVTAGLKAWQKAHRTAPVMRRPISKPHPAFKERPFKERVSRLIKSKYKPGKTFEIPAPPKVIGSDKPKFSAPMGGVSAMVMGSDRAARMLREHEQGKALEKLARKTVGLKGPVLPAGEAIRQLQRERMQHLKRGDETGQQRVIYEWKIPKGYDYKKHTGILTSNFIYEVLEAAEEAGNDLTEYQTDIRGDWPVDADIFKPLYKKISAEFMTIQRELTPAGAIFKKSTKFKDQMREAALKLQEKALILEYIISRANDKEIMEKFYDFFHDIAAEITERTKYSEELTAQHLQNPYKRYGVKVWPPDGNKPFFDSKKFTTIQKAHDWAITLYREKGADNAVVWDFKTGKTVKNYTQKTQLKNPLTTYMRGAERAKHGKYYKTDTGEIVTPVDDQGQKAWTQVADGFDKRPTNITTWKGKKVKVEPVYIVKNPVQKPEIGKIVTFLKWNNNNEQVLTRGKIKEIDRANNRVAIVEDNSGKIIEVFTHDIVVKNPITTYMRGAERAKHGKYYKTDTGEIVTPVDDQGQKVWKYVYGKKVKVEPVYMVKNPLSKFNDENMVADYLLNSVEHAESLDEIYKELAGIMVMPVSEAKRFYTEYEKARVNLLHKHAAERTAGGKFSTDPKMAVRQLREQEQLVFDIAKKYLRIKNPVTVTDELVAAQGYIYRNGYDTGPKFEKKYGFSPLKYPQYFKINENGLVIAGRNYYKMIDILDARANKKHTTAEQWHNPKKKVNSPLYAVIDKKTNKVISKIEAKDYEQAKYLWWKQKGNQNVNICETKKNPAGKKTKAPATRGGIGLSLPIDEHGKIPLFTIGTLAKLKVLSVKKGRPLMYKYNEDQKIGVYGSHDKQVIVISKIDTRRIK